MQTLIQHLEKFIITIFVLFFTEIVFGGPGSWSIVYLNVNLRFTFFALVCIALLLNALIKLKTLRMLDFSIFIIGILCFIFWIFTALLDGSSKNFICRSYFTPIEF